MYLPCPACLPVNEPPHVRGKKAAYLTLKSQEISRGACILVRIFKVKGRKEERKAAHST